MKNKKGFTLVELMAVIVVLAIIISIATTSAISISHKTKIKMYNSKVDMIIKAAELYGQDNPKKVTGTALCENDATITCANQITIKNLIDDGKLKKDDIEGGEVKNPIDNSSLNDFKICLYKKCNRVYAQLIDCNKDWNKNDVLNDDNKNYCKP